MSGADEIDTIRIQTQTGTSTTTANDIPDIFTTTSTAPLTLYANAYNGTTYLGPVEADWAATGAVNSSGFSAATGSSITFDPSATASGAVGSIEASWQSGCMASALTGAVPVSVFADLFSPSLKTYSFTTLNAGEAAPLLITLTNNSGADQEIGALTVAGDSGTITVTPDFSEGDTLLADEVKDINTSFAPANGGTYETTLQMAFGNPVLETQLITLSGEARGIPALVTPADGSTGIATSTDLSWNAPYVPASETADSAVYINTSDDFTGVDPLAMNADKPAFAYAGIGLLIALSAAGSVLAGKNKRRKLLGIFLVMLVIGVFLLGCSISGDKKDPGDDPVPGDTTQPVSGLEPGTTYYWKVVTTYSSGDALESEVWTFTTAE